MALDLLASCVRKGLDVSNEESYSSLFVLEMVGGVSRVEAKFWSLPSEAVSMSVIESLNEIALKKD